MVHDCWDPSRRLLILLWKMQKRKTTNINNHLLLGSSQLPPKHTKRYFGGGGWGCSFGIHELPGSSHWLKRFAFCWPGTSRRVLKRMAKPLASKRPFGFFSMTKWVSQQGGLPVVGVYIPMKQGFPSKGGIIPICAFYMIRWWFPKYSLFLPLLGEMI